ncbi:MAG: NAD-dependent deacylase [Verrucomicrobiales bacterium]|nr:NAD-dependent deacylase [Verrucomicrobiales bacterium]
MISTIPGDLLGVLRSARHVVVLTGAGFSAESGVPTFREAQTGLWARFRPEELATPEAFARHPREVWDWYAWRRVLVAKARPHAGHRALVELARRVPTLTLITQNVDGLHQRSGCREVIELHGNLTRVRCAGTCGTSPLPESPDTLPPPCPCCGQPLRPDVVWFGESLPADALAQAWQAAGACDLLFSIGTSTLVYPAAALPEVALDAGASVVEVNPDETPLSRRATWCLRGKAASVLPLLLERTWAQEKGKPLQSDDD